MKMKILIFMHILLLAHGVDARYISIKNDTQFIDEINKFEFVLACFIQIPHGEDGIDKNLKKDIQMVQDTVKATSETAPYKKILKHDVGFLVIDVTKDSLDLLIQKYNITDQELPQFLLFRNGKVVSTMSGELAKLSGFVSKSDILEFIDDYFGQGIDEILSKISEDQEHDREMQLARYDAYAAHRYRPHLPYNAWSREPNSGYNNFYPYGYGYYGFNYWI